MLLQLPESSISFQRMNVSDTDLQAIGATLTTNGMPSARNGNMICPLVKRLLFASGLSQLKAPVGPFTSISAIRAY